MNLLSNVKLPVSGKFYVRFELAVVWKMPYLVDLDQEVLLYFIIIGVFVELAKKIVTTPAFDTFVI